MEPVQDKKEMTNGVSTTPCQNCLASLKHLSDEDLRKDVTNLRRQLQTLQEAVDRLTKGYNPAPPQIQKSTEGEGVKPPEPPASRVKYIVSKIDDNGNRIESPGNPLNSSKTERSESDFAFEAKEVFNEKGRSISQITPISHGLRDIIYKVLKKQFEHNKDTQWAEREPGLNFFQAPFTLLLSYWSELTKEASLPEDDDAKRKGKDDLKLLLQHIRNLQPQLILQVESLPKATRISRNHIDILFRTGTLVVSRPHLGQPQLFKVHSLSYGPIDPTKTEIIITIKCWAYDWRGKSLARIYYNFSIRSFYEEKEIKDLPCYPVQYYEDENGNRGLEALKNTLIMRGKKYRKICTKAPGAKSMCLYNGCMVEIQRPRRPFGPSFGPSFGPGFPPPKAEWIIQQRLVSEPIMVDFESFQQECQEILPIGTLIPWPHINPCSCSLCLDPGDREWITGFSHTPEGDGGDVEDETDRNYLLLPSRLVGYAFKSGCFAQFFVDDVEQNKDEQPGQEYDDRLIFPEDKEENKTDIKRLILGHKSDEGERTIGDRPLISDAVEGKGKGLVMLLHGPPGVGKTLTAELGARAASRPLYKVGASDIGLNPEHAEKSFSRLFQLTSRWQAVLLIDEAEVFLDTRGPKGESDIKKNALVSVLLRALEYFQGVLIMTTNRVMTLDPAMVSRIHYAVSLGPLDKDQETKIWKSYTEQLNSKNCGDISNIKRWVEMKTKKKTSDMNGRQIRNLFTTAQALAEGELVEGETDGSGKITLDHFKRVNETMTTFREDMQELLILARTDAAKSYS